MIFPLVVERVLADRPRAEVGSSSFIVVAPAGTHVVVGGHDPADAEDGYPIGVYARPTQRPEASGSANEDRALRWIRTERPLRAAAFHPTEPLLVLGTGSYDGGYSFEGEFILFDLAAGEHRHLFADDSRREVRSLEWTDTHTLELLLAPPDDWEDRTAWSEGYRVKLTRPDWRTVPAHSIRHQDLLGPRVPAHAPQPTATHAAGQDGRRLGEIRFLTLLPDGDILLTADHILLERWSAEGERRWSLPADPALGGGRLAIVADGNSAWVETLGPCRKDSGAFLRITLSDGVEVARHTTQGPATLVATSDGPLLVPMPAGYGDRARSLFRHGPHAIFRDTPRPPCTCGCPYDDDEDCDCRCTCSVCEGAAQDEETWLTVVDDPTGADPTHLTFPSVEHCRRLFPWSWEPGETHSGGPGIWTGETDLVMATVRQEGRIDPHKQGFVTRRPLREEGAPSWVFRVSRTPTALDLDPSTGTVLIALRGGELIALDATTGALRACGHIQVRGATVIPTALTVIGPGQILLGTSDARILTCRLQLTEPRTPSTWS